MDTDPRLRDFIGQSNEGTEKIHILEFPSDQGVFINGGRQGAAKAPELIRARLNNLTPHADFYQKHTNILERTVFSGTIPCEKDVEADQQRLGDAVKERLNKGILPVIIGGGHETAFGHFLGYAKSEKPVTIINIDAHTDLRELKNGQPHSGSPFQQAIGHTSKCCSGYHVFGLNPASVSLQHYKFAKQNGSASFESETTVKSVLERLEKTKGSVMVTMDMDSVNQAEAPGVSAPNSSGISRQCWLDLAFEFGKHSNVTSMDLSEVNPLFDRDNQTVNLAALTIWNFLLGVSMR